MLYSYCCPDTGWWDQESLPSGRPEAEGGGCRVEALIGWETVAGTTFVEAKQSPAKLTGSFLFP
jgi:hypothetical protein